MASSMIAQFPFEKTCSHCHQVKPITQFYAHPSAFDGHQPYCASCSVEFNQTRRMEIGVVDRSVARHKGEVLLIEYLRNHNIYAAPGKCSEWKWVDVIAWGCVRIEVKYSRNLQQRFSFTFSNKQRKNGLQVDVLALICDDGSAASYHFFSAKDPELSGIKTSLAFTRGASVNRRPGILNADNMNRAMDRIDLIETTRLYVAGQFTFA